MQGTISPAAGGSNFVTISKNIYVCRPDRRLELSRTEKEVDSQDPTVILIFGWMGAQLSHLHKYTNIYEELYPNATKILVRTQPIFFFRPQSMNDASLQPLKSILAAEGCLAPVTNNPPPRVLVHTFSNGGGSGLTTLGRILSKYPRHPLISALMVDSAPGRSTFLRGLRAFTAHLRNPLFKLLIKLFLTASFGVFGILRFIFRWPHPIDILHHDLLVPSVLPCMSEKTPRLYVYSREDKMVDSDHVEEHLVEVRRRGYVVRTERFEGTEHVNHARSDPERYWGAMRSLWEEARRLSAPRPDAPQKIDVKVDGELPESAEPQLATI